MVGISLLTLVPGELGGSETYVRELLRGLGRVGEQSYRVLLPPAAPAAAEGLPAETATEYRHAHTIPERLVAMAAAAARPGPLRRRLRGAGVVHYPLTLQVPAMSPSVVTLHDVQHLDLPRMFPRSELLFRRVAWHRSIRAADRVIVLSEFVRDRAVATLGLDRARIRVVPSGLDHALLTPGVEEREPFLLYPARRWPHKNHERLFEAFALVRRERPELRLVLTGGGDDGAVPDGVESRGRLPWPELVRLMQHASALVFPSLYEGFGLPPLEAMACGLPVCSSNAGALPETVGGAARLFDPHDPRAIAAAVLDVLDSPEEWRRRGLVRAAEFSWDATARATDAVYAELL
ncbi:MAG TPA: glycosyltransferase family 1 protein [Gaiellaceae bacterium]|nr:glycosyltransferase family 1 protein [Gaiellaceae bacterium]